MNVKKHLLAFSCIGLLSALLAGCDGATITITPKSSATSVASSTSSDCSLAPGAPACYVITTANCTLGDCAPVYRVMDGCGVSKLPSNQSASFIKAGATDCAAPMSSRSSVSSSSAVTQSSSSCKSLSGTSNCYAITEKSCVLGTACPTTYRVLDNCGVDNVSSNLIAKYVKGGDYNCQAQSTSSSSSSSVPVTTACSKLDGRTYFTTTVEESGRAPNGIAMHHWRISFKDGELNLIQSDFGVLGTYSCQGEQVTATINYGTPEEKVLRFNADFSQLAFHPFGSKDLTYVYQPASSQAVTACEDVAGNKYSNTINSSTAVPNNITFLDFNKDGNTVTYGYSDIREAGHYECDLGTLHVHLNGKNATPMKIDVAKYGASVTIVDKQKTLLYKDEQPTICTLQYDPVCASYDTGLRCITTPCDTFVYKTYGNACAAGADKSTVLFKGECGAKEGKPVQEEPIICPANYAPVCAKAKANIACIKAPCPSHEYKTFSNTCVATAAKAMVSFFSSCDTLKLENQVSFEQQPVRLYTPASSSIMQIQPSSKGIKIIDAAIKEDILTVTLGYSGCSKQAIYYNVDSSILSKSLPAQVSYSFSKEKEDLCDAYFESTYQYDLLPLRANFRNQVEGQYGLGILGASTIYKR